MMQDTYRGSPRARKWPRARKTTMTANQQENMEKFAEVQRAANYITPDTMAYWNKATANSPLLPRDGLTMMLYNRWAAINIQGLGWRWPMPAVTEVSETLDVLGEAIGSTLLRTPEGWRAGTDPNSGAGAWNAHLATIVTPSPTYVAGQLPAQFNSAIYNPRGWWNPALHGFTPDRTGLYMCFGAVSSTGSRSNNLWSGRDGVIQFDASTFDNASRSPRVGFAPVVIDTVGQTAQLITQMTSAGGYSTVQSDNWFLFVGPIAQ